jgi:hypothetical protein
MKTRLRKCAQSSAFAVIVAIGLASATPASAAITQGSYTTVSPSFPVNPGDTNGGYVRCPDGQRVVGQGAYWHQSNTGADPGNAPTTVIGAAAPTADGLGAFSSGKDGISPKERHVVMQCLPASTIGTPYTTVAGDTPAVAHNVAGGYLACPDGQRVVSGGAFWHLPGQSPNQALATDSYVGSSSPTSDARGWYADGYNINSSPRVLTTVIQCLPDAGFNAVTTETYTVKVPVKKRKHKGKRRLAEASKKKKGKRFRTETRTRSVTHVGQYSIVSHESPDIPRVQGSGGYVSCPPGQRIVTGGAFWHAPGAGPSPALASLSRVSSSAPTPDGSGWYADGLHGSDSALRLHTVLLCIAPVAG